MKKLSLALFAISYLIFASFVRADGGETVCTPVYGMANSCAEHTVVDTSLETGAFYNLAALSYFGGLAAFIKSKRGQSLA